MSKHNTDEANMVGDELARLHRAANVIHDVREPSQVLRTVAQIARDSFGALYVVVLLSTDAGELQVQEVEGANRLAEDFRRPRPNGVSAQVLAGRSARFLHDTLADSSAHPEMLADGVRAAACLPLHTAGRTFGVLWMHYAEPHAFAEAEQWALQLFANEAAVAYDNARRLAELEAVSDVARALTDATDERAALKHIAATARRLLQGDYAFIYPYDASSDRFVGEQAVADNVPEQLLQSIPRTGRIGRQVLEGRYVSNSDVGELPTDQLDVLNIGYLNQLSVRAFQGIRLEVKGEYVGVLFVDYTHRRRFTADERQALERFAHYAAAALQQARTHGRLRTAANAMGAVAEASAHGEVRDALRAIVEHGRAVLRCQIVTVYAYDPERQVFTLSDIEGRASEYAGAAEDLSPDPAVQWVVDLKDTDYHIASDPDDPLLSGQFATRHGLRSCLAVQLRKANACVGAMFFNYRRVHRFSVEEIDTAREFADLAATAISNAQLHETRERYLTQLNTAFESTRALDGSAPLESFAQRMCEMALQTVSLDQDPQAFSHVGLLDDVGRLRFIAASRSDVLEDLRETQRYGIDLRADGRRAIGIAGRAVASGCVQHVSNVADHPDYIRLRPATGSQLSVPIRLGETILGVISIEDSRTTPFLDGEIKAVEHVARNIAIAAENYKQYVFAREARRQKEATLQALHAASQCAVEGDLQGALRAVARGARAAFNNSIATVYAFRDDAVLEKRRFIGVARDGYEGAGIDESADLPEDSLLRKLLHLSEPAYIIDDDLLLTRHARGQNLESAIGMALRFGNQTVGVLMLGYRYVRSWSADEVEEVQRFGRLVATIICQTQLLDQTRRQVQALTALHEAGQTIARHTSREDTIQRILEQALDVLGADRGKCISHLALVKGDALEFHVNRPELLNRRRRVNLRREARIGISGRVVTGRAATNVPDVLNDPDYVPFEDDIRSQISVPVMSAERLVGVLSVEHTSPRAFSDDDQHNLELLAAQAAIGLENAALHEQLEAIRAVARVSVVGELGNILRAIVYEARSRLGCDAAVIYTYDDSIRQFAQAHCDGCDPSLLKDPRALGEQSAAWRLITAEPMAYTPPGEDGHWLIDGTFARSLGLRSSLAMALMCRDADGVERRVGVLFISYTAEILFGPEDEERARDLAHLAAISILNAQRHEQLRSLERSRRAGLALAGLTVMTNTWMHSVYNDVNGIDQHLAAIDRYLGRELNVGEVRSSLHEVRTIIARIRDERRRPPQSPDDEQTLIPISDFIHERVQQLSERSRYSRVRLELGDLAGAMAVVRANKHQLQRALEIIIDNAVHAVASLDALRRRVTIASRVVGGDVEICVHDEGPGISPHVLSQLELQQPIQKLDKAGLGYGLVLAWFIAELHRGRLEFANRRPFGATVSLRLPLVNTEDSPI